MLSRDRDLLHILENELADATRRGGDHLACRPGCTPCCHGIFRISALDAVRLRTALETHPDRACADAIRTRAHHLQEALRPGFPGNGSSGLLDPEDARWHSYADTEAADAACPVLDPQTGRCELYVARPTTCRVFGPPVRTADGIGICELCYVGATREQVLEGELHLDHEALEAELQAELAHATNLGGETLIPWALLEDAFLV